MKRLHDCWEWTADAIAMGIAIVIHIVLGWFPQDDEGIP